MTSENLIHTTSIGSPKLLIKKKKTEQHKGEKKTLSSETISDLHE